MKVSDTVTQAPVRAAEELVALVEKKYKNRYDMTIARRDFAGKSFVSLNVMWVHTGQRSFPMSEEDYMDKIDGICMLMNVWNKQTQVRSLLTDVVQGMMQSCFIAIDANGCTLQRQFIVLSAVLSCDQGRSQASGVRAPIALHVELGDFT